MQYWDEILYPRFLATVRGENYIVMSDADIDNDLYNLTCRAISAFKFSRIQLAFSYEEVVEDEVTSKRYYFLNELGLDEIEVLLAQMKAFWAENLISTTDSYNQLYYDKDIKTYSPAAAMEKGIKLMTTFRQMARESLFWYSRAKDYTPTVGDINE